MTNNWNPEQYEKFKAQRAKPFFDLMNLLEQKPMDFAVDLGCGTGELTQTLFKTVKPKKLVGIDASSKMLGKSKKFESENLSFQLIDIAHFKPAQKFDLVFSNAALQWVPGHEEIIPKILNWVSDEGQIAIQMPFNFDHPSHLVADRVAKQLFPTVFKNHGQRHTLNLERYAEILFCHGFKSQTARIEIYGHPMASGREVIEWTKGTLLTGYQSKLNEIQFAEFLNNYTEELITEIGEGPYFYAFKRALIWGSRS